MNLDNLDLGRQLPFPLDRGYNYATQLGRVAYHQLGRSGALDNLVVRDRQRELGKLSSAELVLSLDETPQPAAGEIAVVKEFLEVHGAQDQAQMEAVDPSAPPEPLALKLLDRLMDERIHDPIPEPPEEAGQTQRARM